MDIMTDWGTLPLPDILNKLCIKMPLKQALIGHAKWEPLELPELTHFVNIKQYEYLVRNITALFSDMLKIGV